MNWNSHQSDLSHWTFPNDSLYFANDVHFQRKFNIKSTHKKKLSLLMIWFVHVLWCKEIVCWLLIFDSYNFTWVETLNFASAKSTGFRALLFQICIQFNRMSTAEAVCAVRIEISNDNVKSSLLWVNGRSENM